MLPACPRRLQIAGPSRLIAFSPIRAAEFPERGRVQILDRVRIIVEEVAVGDMAPRNRGIFESLAPT
jgi:hypothetical protein